MGWMHKGAFSCAYELMVKQETDGYIRYFLSQVAMLMHYKVIPVIVFDGAKLPQKAMEDESRDDKRQAARAEAEALIKEKGNLARDDRTVRAKCQGAIAIETVMVDRVVAALKQLGVSLLFAPYEADAQLAFMCKRGDIAAVVTEDSDIIVYGAPMVFYKMDRYGEGEVWDLRFIGDPASETTDTRNLGKLAALRNWTMEMFCDMCVLAGCDYSSHETRHIKGLGIVKAFDLVDKHGSGENVIRFMAREPANRARIPGCADVEGDAPVEAFIRLFREMRVPYLQHNVFDSRNGEVVSIGTAWGRPDIGDLEGTCGKRFDKTTAIGIATGSIHPRSLQRRDTVPLNEAEKRRVNSVLESKMREMEDQQRQREWQESQCAMRSESSTEPQGSQVEKEPVPLDLSGQVVTPEVDAFAQIARGPRRQAAPVKAVVSSSDTNLAEMFRGLGVLEDVPASQVNVPSWVPKPVAASLSTSGSTVLDPPSMWKPADPAPPVVSPASAAAAESGRAEVDVGSMTTSEIEAMIRKLTDELRRRGHTQSAPAAAPAQPASKSLFAPASSTQTRRITSGGGLFKAQDTSPTTPKSQEGPKQVAPIFKPLGLVSRHRAFSEEKEPPKKSLKSDPLQKPAPGNCMKQWWLHQGKVTVLDPVDKRGVANVASRERRAATKVCQ